MSFELHPILPEVWLVFGLIFLIVLDLIFKANKNIVGNIAVVFLCVDISLILYSGFNTLAFVEGHKVYQFFATDGLATVFKLIIATSTLIVMLQSSFYKDIQKDIPRVGEYYSLMFGMLIGMQLLTMTKNYIFMYVSIELLSLSSYVLAGFLDKDKRSAEASLKYMIYGAAASGLMLFGISFIYGLTGSLTIEASKFMDFTSSANSYMFYFAVTLLAVGIGFKLSAAPFHFWTPDVYEGAPITITALLSVASKAAGFIILLRVILLGFVTDVNSATGYWILNLNYDWIKVLAIISVLSMTVGNFAALWQKNVKRLLAYSSIGHAGYMLAAISLTSTQGMNAMIFYMAIYMIMNLGAFFIVVLVSNKTDGDHLTNFDGVGYKMPLAGVALTIFLVSLTGLPPTAGFVAKLYLLTAVIDSGRLILALVIILNTVVSLYYYVRVIKHMYMKEETIVTDPKLSLSVKALIIALVIPTLLFGIYFSPLMDFLKNFSLFTY